MGSGMNGNAPGEQTGYDDDDGKDRQNHEFSGFHDKLHTKTEDTETSRAGTTRMTCA